MITNDDKGGKKIVAIGGKIIDEEIVKDTKILRLNSIYYVHQFL